MINKKVILAALLFFPLIAFSMDETPEKTVVADNANLVSPLLIGHKIPDIMLWSTQGKPFKLRDKVAQKPTVLLFYRGGWCPFCNAQLSQIQKIDQQLNELGYQLLAISPDTPDALLKTSKDKELSYELISDFQLAATIGFGLAFNIPDDYAKLIAKHGGKPVQAAGDNKSTLPVPAVFILDKEGYIQFEYINPNFRVRVSPELLLTAAKLSLDNQ